MCLMQEGEVNVRTSTRTKIKPHDPGRRSSKVVRYRILSYGGLWLAIYDRYNMWHGKHPHNCPGFPRTVISDWSTNETMRQALILFHRRSLNKVSPHARCHIAISRAGPSCEKRATSGVRTNQFSTLASKTHICQGTTPRCTLPGLVYQSEVIRRVTTLSPRVGGIRMFSYNTHNVNHECGRHPRRRDPFGLPRSSSTSGDSRRPV